MGASSDITIWGVDVSALQGLVPFDALAQAGCSFAYLRCKIGNDSGHDSRFAANVAAAKSCGIIQGAYHFAYPLPHLRPADQVRGFIEAAMVDGDHPLGAHRGELPMALDLEWPPPEGLRKPDGTTGKGWREWGCNAPQIRDWCLEALEETHAALGYAPIVYSYPHWLARVLEGATARELDSFARYPLWIAGGKFYQTSNGELPNLAVDRPPAVPAWGSAWKVWQFDGNGGKRLPNGVDADFNVFNGSAEDLREFAGLPGYVPPTPTVSALDPIAVANRHMLDEEIRAYRASRGEEAA